MRNQFIPTRKHNPCEVCGDTSGKCREISGSENRLCGNIEASVDGWRSGERGKKNSLWTTFFPDSKVVNSAKSVEQRNKENAAREAEERKFRASLTPVATRDKTARAAAGELAYDHQQSLLNRGLTLSEVGFAVSQKWLYSGHFGRSRGFHISAMSLDGKIQGSQFARDDREPKYIWVSKGKSVSLPETGENPLFVWKHPQWNENKPSQIQVTEGALKPLVAALKYWRSGDYQTIFVGAGSPPGEETIKKLISDLQALGVDVSVPGTFKLNPDAGWVDAASNVESFWENWFKPMWNAKVIPLVNWWGQYHKTSNDVDELDGTETIRTLTGTQFLRLRKWDAMKKFSPDHVVESKFCQFSQHVKEGHSVQVRAGLGSGKTHETIELLKARQSNSQKGAIVIVPTRKLARDFTSRATRQGLKYTYLLKTDNGRRFLADPHATIVICPDSLIHLKHTDFSDKVVVVDEANANWVALTTRKTAIAKYREDAISILRDGFVECESVILLDGNLSDKASEFWDSMTSGKKSVKVKHKSTDLKGFDIKFFDTPDDKLFFAELDRFSRAGKPFVVFSDSRTDLEALDLQFQARGLKGYAIHSKTSSDPWVAEFFGDGSEDSGPDAFITKNRPDYLLLSPSAGSGVDISIKGYFKCRFLLGRGVVSVDDLTQIHVRLRDTECPTIAWVPSEGKPDNNPVKEAITQEEVLEAYEEYFTEVATNATDRGAVEVAKERLGRVIEETAQRTSALIALHNLECKNLRAYFREALLEAGHRVETVTIGKGEVLDTTAQKMQKFFKVEVRLTDAVAVSNAREIEFKEAERLKDADTLSHEDRAAVTRFNLTQRLPGIDTSEEWNSTEEVEVTAKLEDKELAMKTSQQAVFVDRLLNGRVVSQAENQFSYFHPEIPQELEKEKWLEILFGDAPLRDSKSKMLTLQTLKNCGLDAVLEEAGILSRRSLKPLQGEDSVRSLDSTGLYIISRRQCPLEDHEKPLLSSDSPTVKYFIQNCRKKANRLKLGGLAENEKKILSNALNLIGLKLVQAKRAGGNRSYTVVNDIPESVQHAITRRFSEIEVKLYDPQLADSLKAA